jgi:CheY-like chemotaxis protein
MNHPTSPCILVVEDQAIIRTSIAAVLSPCGYHVIEAQDGREALRLAGEYDGRIHVLVTDLHMPRGDGYQLIRQLKPVRPDLRILVLSAAPEEGFPADLSYDAYLRKPVSPPVVVATVQQLLREPRERSRQPKDSDRGNALLAARHSRSITLAQFRAELPQLSCEELQQLVIALTDQARKLG